MNGVTERGQQTRCWKHGPGILASCLLLLVSCSFPGSVPRTVKIGLSAPFEGLYRDLGYEALYAVRLAVRQRNESGGVDGRYLVEMVALNDFNDPQEAVRQVAEMAADPGILGVVGGFSSVVASALVPEYQRLGIAVAAPGMESARAGAEAARVAVEELHSARAAILQGSGGADAALSVAFARGFEAQGGAVIARGGPSAGTDVAGWLARLSPPADLLFLAADAPASAAWIAAARKTGFAQPIMGGPEVGSHLIVDIAGSASEGVYFVGPYAPLASDLAFLDGYQALSGGAPPGPMAAWVYQAANRLMDAMDLAARAERRPSHAAVAAALAAHPSVEGQVYLYVIHDGQVFTPANR